MKLAFSYTSPSAKLDELTSYLEGNKVDYTLRIARGFIEVQLADTASTTTVAGEISRLMDKPFSSTETTEQGLKRKIVKVGEKCHFGDDSVVVIAGPCSVEGHNIFDIAQSVKAAGASMLRGGAFKPRTSPYSFQGLGLDGLKLLKEAGHEAGLPVVSEVMSEYDIEHFVDLNIDMLQIGARNSQNFSLLKEVGKTNIPVLLKRGLSGTYEELIASAHYIMNEGNPHVVLCERGIRTFEKGMRNTLDLMAVPYLHQACNLPIIIDPSHGTGLASYVKSASLSAVVAGVDGLEIEVHNCPDKALSDAEQALNFTQFKTLMDDIKVLESTQLNFKG